MRLIAIVVAGALTLTACADGGESGEVADDTTAPDDTSDDTSDDPSPDTDPDAESPDTPDTSEPSDTDDEPADAGDDDPVGSSVEWGACEGAGDLFEIPGLPTYECASVDVPLDYADPDGATIPIALARQEALDPTARIGSIVFNPGGPGGSGVEYLETARLIMPEDVAERFDLVSFDPRGVGASASVECELVLDDGIVLVADDDRTAWDDALATTLDELDTCATDPADIESMLGTNNAARDLDRIRAALGDERLTYVGFSYGTRLGATYAELFPDRVRALVLDGGVAPTDDFASLGAQQAAGFDLALGNFAAACDADPDCAAGALGPTLDVLADVRADIAEAGTFPTADPDRVLTPGELNLGTIAALYSRSTWVYLAWAIEEAATSGEGSVFQALADLYLGREPDGSYTNQVEAGAFINCADDPSRPGVDEVWANADAVADGSEFFGDDLRASFGCLGFADPVDPLILGPADGAPPILVIGTTGDPATPYDWSNQLADSLASGVLFSVEGEGHTAYTSIACVTPVVNAYLIDLDVPEAGDGCVDDSDVDPFPPAGESDAELVIGFVDCLIDNGADVEPIGIADILADPSGQSLLGSLPLGDPELLAALLPCQEFLGG